MDILKTSGEVLKFVFGRLRLQEGIAKGRVTAQMKDEMIFKVLVNAFFKQENGLALTELENIVKKESGTYITMYVAQKWDAAKKECSYKALPYEEVSHLTVSDLTRLDRVLRGSIA